MLTGRLGVHVFCPAPDETVRSSASRSLSGRALVASRTPPTADVVSGLVQSRGEQPAGRARTEVADFRGSRLDPPLLGRVRLDCLGV